MVYKKTRNCPICGKELVYGSYSAYHLACKNNALCRKCAIEKRDKHRKCDVSPLIEETPEAYYWIGFLLADGHFYDGRITFHLCLKDVEQVKKFGTFVNFTGKYRENEIIGTTISVKHTEIVKKICDKFDIKSNKTYIPPMTILNHDKELLKYLFIGFVDGDGCIRMDGIMIKVHYSWFNILEEFSTLFGPKINAKLTKDGYATIRIPRKIVEEQIIQLLPNIPYLKRKWNRVMNMNNENVYNSYNLSEQTKKIIALLKKGLSTQEISLSLHVTKGHVLKVKSQYNISVKRVDKEKSQRLKKEIIQCLKQGLKYREIKDKLSVCESYISRINKLYKNEEIE